MKVRPALLACALGVLSACDETPVSHVCDANPGPAVAVFVTHGPDQYPLVREASGWYTVGARRDTLLHRQSVEGEFLAAFGASGVYEVEVHARGHEPWVARGVVVEPGLCGPRTTRIVANLVPNP